MPSNFPPGVTGAEPQITGEDPDDPGSVAFGSIGNPDAPEPVSWAPEVLVEGKWAGNATRFATEAEAFAAGAELLSRWWVPTDHRAVPSSDPVNYRMVDGLPKAVR